MGVDYIGITIPENYSPIENRYDRLIDLVRELIESSREFLIYCKIKIDKVHAEAVIYKGSLLDARVEVNGKTVRGVRAWAIIEDLCELSGVEAVIYRFKPIPIE